MPGASIIAAIPARHASSRLPGKPLRDLGGKPLVQHVWERVDRAPELARVVVLTDDERIVTAVRGFGGDVEMTPADCSSGTDRIAWAAQDWSCDAVINVQGDRPLVDPDEVSILARHLQRHPDDAIATVATPTTEEAAADPNAVKVVRGVDGSALYFSRAPIPYRRRENGAERLLHVGIYGYRHRVLLDVAALPPSPLERSEGLEQLRWLEHGYPIRVLVVESSAPGVDTEEDLQRAAAIIAEKPGLG